MRQVPDSREMGHKWKLCGGFPQLDIRGVFSENMFEKRKLISNLAPQLKNPVRIVINHEGLLAKRNPEINNVSGVPACV